MTTAMPILYSPRLLVRQCEMSDLVALRNLDDLEVTSVDADSMDPLGDWLAWSVANYEQLARLAQPPYGDRAIVLRQTGELIGLCGLVPTLMNFEQIPEYAGQPVVTPVKETVPEVGLYYHVATAFRRQGYATEAAQALVDYSFETLHLRRIVATTQYANTGSMGVMRSLGMRVGRNPFDDPPWLQVVGILDNPGKSAHP
ncbi:MAG: GNAT family N-acetyltransferase [Caldilineaceae bacterium]